MIINKDQTPNAQYVGDVKANKVGIDTKNIDFVASLLTTNLYSNPIQSFLRETVSNGWDSHVEAGNPEPVIISLKSDEPKEFKSMAKRQYGSKKVSITITIRDFGVGLSPERFANIYTNIGSSTKRDSNDFIGAFGIGRFSCLSCSDSATLNSYHNGTRYSYLMYKDGTGINIDQLGKFPTDAKNGLSVQVTLQMDYYKVQELINGLTALAFFNCIYLDDSQKLLLDFAEQFNARKSVYLKSFGVWDMGNYSLKRITSYNSNKSVNIVVGNCIYPFTKEQLYAQSKLPKNLPIYLHFDIGELDVTPNREAILYNPKTDAAILTKAKEAVEELKSIIMKQDHIDFPSLLDWYKYKQENTVTISIPLNKDEVYKMYLNTQTVTEWAIPSTCTIKGKDIPRGPMLALMENLMDSYIPDEVIKFRYEISGSAYYTTMPRWNHVKLIDAITKHHVVTTDDIIWKSVLKDYVKSTYLNKRKHQNYGTNYVLSRTKAAYALRSRLRQLIRVDNSHNHACLRYILKELDFKKMFVNCNADTIPTDYVTKWEANKKAQKAALSTNTTPTVARKCVIYTLKTSERYDYSTFSYGVITDSDIYTLDSMSKSGKLFVYTSNDNIEDLKHAWYIFGHTLELRTSTEFICVAPSNIPTIAALSNTIDLSTYLYTRKNDLIAIYKDVDWSKATMLKSVKYRHWETIVMEFPELWAKVVEYASYYEKVDGLRCLSGSHANFFIELLKKYREKKWENPRIKEIQSDEALFTFILWSKNIHHEEISLPIFADYVYRSGISKLTKKAYDAYKNSPFYKSFIKL